MADNELTRASSLADFDKAADNAWYLDEDHTLHLRKSLPTQGNATISISAKEIASLLDEVEAQNNCVFEYSTATGLYSYSLPAGAADATLTVVDLGGAVMAEIPLPSATSIRQVATPSLPSGLYISTLSAHLPGGALTAHTIKTPLK